MDLFIFILLAVVLGITLLFCSCAIYFALTRRPIKLALSLSWKMLLACVIGFPMTGIGGIALSTYFFQSALEDREDFLLWREIVVGLLISTASTVALYFSYLLMAFEILE